MSRSRRTRNGAPPRDEVYWYASRPPPHLLEGPLETRRSLPVVIVGGGMAGLMCAERLLDGGVPATLLEDSFCGGGASGRSSGFITPDSELELADLVRNEGPGEGRRLWEFARGGVDAIEETIRRFGLDCDFRVQDSLFVAGTLKGLRAVEAEHEMLRRMGYPSRFYSSGTVRDILGGRNYHGGVRTPGTFGISAFRYCQALKEALAARGVDVFERTPVRAIEGRRVHTDRGVLTAGKVIVCTDRFLPHLRVIPREIYHAQTFLAASTPLSDGDIARIFPEDPLMVWDTDLIYQYFRLTGDGRLLLGAASLLMTYFPSERHGFSPVVRKMRAYFARRFPQVDLELDYVWPGLIGVSKDFVPLAGVDPGNPDAYFVGGAAGLPWAAALGRYVADKFLTGRDDFDGHFSPFRRFPVGRAAQALLRKPLAFALSHGIEKYLAR